MFFNASQDMTSQRGKQSYLGDLKNSALGQFWEIFLGGMGGTANQCGKFGKIRKNLENLENSGGGDRVQTGGGQTFPKNFRGGPSLVIPPLLPRYDLP